MFSRDRSNYRKVPVNPGQAVAQATSLQPPQQQPTRLLVDDDAPPIADYDYPSVRDKNTCKCRGGRLVGRINVMREDPIPPGDQHAFYPGLRSRICCVIPAGWPMLFVTIGLLVVPTISMLVNIHPTAAFYGWFILGTTSLLSIGTLLNVTFRDPGIFPRYSRPMGETDKWALCQKTNSYRHRGVTFCTQSQVLIDRLDHYCPWSATTIGRNNMGAFELFVCVSQHHVALFFVVAIVGFAMKFDPDLFPHIQHWLNATVVPLLPAAISDRLPDSLAGGASAAAAGAPN